MQISLFNRFRNRADFGKSFLQFAVIVLLLGCASYGRAQDENRFTFDVGGGVTPLVGNISNRLDNGWNFGVSGGLNVTRSLSTSVKFSYDRLGVSQSLLNRVAVPDGDSHVWSLTFDPKLRLAGVHAASPYIVGGVGYYRRTINFSEPVTATTIVFDPIFDVSFPVGVAGDLVVRSISKGGIGGNLGGGFDFKIGDSGLKLFTEARYVYADTGNIPTKMVPVEFGIRW